MPRPTRSGTRPSRRLMSTSDLQEPRSGSRLSSRSPTDLPDGPSVIELATGIAETVADRLAAQISSSLETLRLEVSSSIAQNQRLGANEPNLPQRSSSLADHNVPDEGNAEGKPRVPGFKEVAKGTRDGPADVSELASFGGAAVQADSSLPVREKVDDDECPGKHSPPSDCHYERSNCVGHCSPVCPHWNNHDLRSRLPKLEIPRFAGDPMEWPMFSSAFHQSVHSVLNSDADRLCILRELLAPQVRKAMAKYLYDPRQYTQALEVLQRRYGDPQRLVRACLKSVAALRPWHDFDYDRLRAFSDELQSIVSVLSLGGHEVEICSSTNVNTVVKKMPRQLRDEWGQFVTRSIRPRFPSLQDLSDWISERREAADMITDESDDPPCGVQRSLYDKKRRPRMVAAATLPDASALACPLCGGAHLLPSCPTFIRMRMERRAEVVRTKGCCYRCLQPGHTAKRCNTRSRCSETGCRAAHHPMLHGAPRLFDKKEPSETTRREQNEPFAGAVCDEKPLHCLLPIVPLVLVAPDGRCYRTRALLDSGSEVSMIHMDVANALGLKGARESCRFTTFHDQQRTLSVRRVSFRIKSTDGLYTEDIEDAYAVPKLQLPNQIKSTGTAVQH
ncbi:hypothetical protein M513_13350 [Trichuris suis]|uniref:CCHC-type domain-containing protein n=1 Tax=Trichuris suis TaxID=68888 RepID=A0A085LLC6_9BILA|nr:hypothetical protein M513_13350 [Trichuris suis]